MTAWGEPRPDDDPYWAQQGKAWVEYAPGKKRLVDLNKPAPIPLAKSDIGFPMIYSDQMDTPLQSMADGKMYDSRSNMLKSYKASGNPQGVDYEVVGDAPVEPYSRPARTKEDEKQTHEAISRALDEHGI